MGYACPVCSALQMDAEHLANHLAFSALIHEDEHEHWLNEHTPDWSAHGPEELTPAVAELADEVELPDDFEEGPDPSAVTDELSRSPPGAGPVEPATGLDDEVNSILAEARELTERRRRGTNTSDTTDKSENGDTSDGTGD